MDSETGFISVPKCERRSSKTDMSNRFIVLMNNTLLPQMQLGGIGIERRKLRGTSKHFIPPNRAQAGPDGRAVGPPDPVRPG